MLEISKKIEEIVRGEDRVRELVQDMTNKVVLPYLPEEDRGMAQERIARGGSLSLEDVSERHRDSARESLAAALDGEIMGSEDRAGLTKAQQLEVFKYIEQLRKETERRE